MTEGKIVIEFDGDQDYEITWHDDKGVWDLHHLSYDYHGSAGIYAVINTLERLAELSHIELEHR
jgi:hypothetical protein